MLILADTLEIMEEKEENWNTKREGESYPLCIFESAQEFPDRTITSMIFTT